MSRAPDASKSESATGSTGNSALCKPARVELVPILVADVPELARFVAAQSGYEPADVEARFRWLLLENPARETSAPLGWGLRSSDGELVGCILYVPQYFRYRQEIILLMGASSFYVDERHRGSGGVIFLKFAELARKWTLFANSSNADAARLWKARGGIPIPHSDHELFGVLKWAPLIEEILARRGGQRSLSRLAGRFLSQVVGPFRRLKLEGSAADRLAPLTSAEQAMELPINAPSTALTAARDLRYIRWRYFSGRDATVAVFAYRNKQMESDVLVTVNQRPRGYRQQIRTLNVLDIYPAVTPDVGAAIVGVLLARYRDGIDAVVLRGLDAEWQAKFRSLGFVRRRFDAPNGWFLDRAKLLPTRDCYLVPADGDWLI